MTVDAVAQALITLHQPGARERLASGDMSVLEGDLTDDERDMILEAAGADPEVEGFNFVDSGFNTSLSYLATNRKQLSPSVRVSFNDFFSTRYGGAWTIALMG
jgi:hypothetical protein